jgi:SagB-type dehydrogenase family enzyme
MKGVFEVKHLQLDSTTFPELRDRILEAEVRREAIPREPRTYPGYPHWPLPECSERPFVAFDRVLAKRRSARELRTTFPAPPILSRLLRTSHGYLEEVAGGPVPSAGSLQALELYLAVWQSSWLPSGIYHYDRRGHYLSQIVSGTTLQEWHRLVPSLSLNEGGALLWLIIGDEDRVERKYGERGFRFLLLEAGHLMQNLCLVSASLGWVTTPLGGSLDREIARRLQLPPGDQFLYAGILGERI